MLKIREILHLIILHLSKNQRQIKNKIKTPSPFLGLNRHLNKESDYERICVNLQTERRF